MVSFHDPGASISTRGENLLAVPEEVVLVLADLDGRATELHNITQHVSHHTYHHTPYDIICPSPLP